MINWAKENGSVKTLSVKVSENERLDVFVRFDDQCGNGHNTLSITADLIDTRYRGDRRYISCGQLTDEIKEYAPEIEPFLKWHLCSTDGPLHYIANTVYWAGGIREFGDEPNLDYARSCAIWLDATDEEISFNGKDDRVLRARLKERLPSLMAEFRSAVESLGFEYTDVPIRS